jgi:hypothetical protein
MKNGEAVPDLRNEEETQRDCCSEQNGQTEHHKVSHNIADNNHWDQNDNGHKGEIVHLYRAELVNCVSILTCHVRKWQCTAPH